MAVYSGMCHKCGRFTSDESSLWCTYCRYYGAWVGYDMGDAYTTATSSSGTLTLECLSRAKWYLEKAVYPSSKPKNMECEKSSVLEKFATAILPEPQKSFRKAGVTNGDNLLTKDGETIFLSWLLQKHGEEFKKEVVDELLKKDTK